MYFEIERLLGHESMRHQGVAVQVGGADPVALVVVGDCRLSHSLGVLLEMFAVAQLDCYEAVVLRGCEKSQLSVRRRGPEGDLDHP
ncbi:hypothetical protein [Nocardioides insulae]|uniref:hypothetical protein n=1 Tax=Nocardioides insulae TaxID=394734 RepID=UPI000491D1B0|nr:hypothetical protein [Nocardioides insulae]